MIEHVMNITNLRDGLGMVCQHVARTDEPVIVRRYKREDVAIVPLWEWRFFKRLETAIRDGRVVCDEALKKLAESGDDKLDVLPPAPQLSSDGTTVATRNACASA